MTMLDVERYNASNQRIEREIRNDDNLTTVSVFDPAHIHSDNDSAVAHCDPDMVSAFHSDDDEDEDMERQARQ